MRRAAFPVLAVLALAACSAPPSAVAAHSWRAPMTVTAGHCGRLPGGGRGLAYRFANGGSAPAAPVVTVRFTYSRAPGLGVTAEGVTAEVSLAAPGRQGRGKVLAPPGTAFDGCRITSWRVAAVEARA